MFKDARLLPCSVSQRTLNIKNYSPVEDVEGAKES